MADITFADVGRAAVVSLSAHACAGLILLLGGGVDAKHIGKLENLHAANRQHCIVWPSVGLRWFQQLSAAFRHFAFVDLRLHYCGCFGAIDSWPRLSL